MPSVKRSFSGRRAMNPKGYAQRKRSRVSPIGSSQVLGTVVAPVKSNQTTLARAVGPFANSKFVTLLYENGLQQIAGAANLLVTSIKANDGFDVDSSGDFGNKQPLYWDSLLTASGPYRTCKVTSWRTSYTFINNNATTPVQIWIGSPTSSSGDMDSAAEADNWPGVKRLYLTASGSSKAHGSVTVTGHVKDVHPQYGDSYLFTGTYNASPTQLCYQNCVIKGADGTTAPAVYVAIKHEMFCELGNVDSLVS